MFIMKNSFKSPIAARFVTLAHQIENGVNKIEKNIHRQANRNDIDELLEKNKKLLKLIEHNQKLVDILFKNEKKLIQAKGK